MFCNGNPCCPAPRQIEDAVWSEWSTLLQRIFILPLCYAQPTLWEPQVSAIVWVRLHLTVLKPMETWNSECAQGSSPLTTPLSVINSFKNVESATVTSPTNSIPTSTTGLSTDSNTNALLYQIKWGGTTGTGTSLSYSFPWMSSVSAVFSGYRGGAYSYLNEPTAATHYGFNSTQQTAARSAMQTWANVANVSFTEVADSSTNVGDIRFGFTSADRADWGWAGIPNSSFANAGDVWVSTTGTGASDAVWSANSWNYMSLIHEMGHALGLKHPFEGTPVLPAALDSKLYTVMAYNIPTHSLYTSDANLPATIIAPETPMVLDIAAIQYLYGANTTYHTGNDTYLFSPTRPFMQTIWDAGGTDTVSASTFTLPCLIDLNQGHYSSLKFPPPADYISFQLYDGTENLAIAYGCVIENATGGSASDTLIGNSSNNTFFGGGGNDSIDGGTGTDTASFSGNRANYTVAKTASGWTISSVGSLGEGTDTLANVERLKFADSTVALDIAGIGGIAYRIYQAAFNRTPDAGGLGFWIQAMDGGTSLKTVAGEFVNSVEFKAVYGTNPTNAQIVSKFYDNVLHRPGETAGYNFWVGVLDSHNGTVADVLAAFSESAENQAGLVGLIGNGFSYAPYS